MPTLEYKRTAELPDIGLWLLDDSGNLVNFATGWTFAFKLGVTTGQTAVFTKTTGIAGAAGSGTEDAGTPNVTLTFVAGELDGLTAGIYVWQLRATTGGLDRIYQGEFVLGDVVL